MGLIVDMKSKLTGVTSDIYLNDMPDTPDSCLAIFNSGGAPSLHAMDQITAERPSFQVRIRNVSAATAITWAESVKDALDGLATETINSNLYIVVFLEGDILNLGKDDRGRSNLSLNFITMVKR